MDREIWRRHGDERRVVTKRVRGENNEVGVDWEHAHVHCTNI